MKHLSHSQIAQLDRKLERRALELRSVIRRHVADTDRQHYGDIAGLVHDAGDEAVADTLTDISAAFLDRHIKELHEIQAARNRLTDGTFGICTDCGKGIGWDRLNVYPAATCCLSCGERREKAGARSMSSL